MKRLGIVRNKWKSLDMVSIHAVKRQKLTNKNLMVFVNSPLFFKEILYSFQYNDNRYASLGLLALAWQEIDSKRYEEADRILNQILKYWKHSSELYFAKFIVTLFQDKDAFPYLQEAIENKKEDSFDDSYRLFLLLYEKMGEDYDTIPLMELLTPAKSLIAFNANSFNGRYLTFLKEIGEDDFSSARKSLNRLEQMKKDDIALAITSKILNLIIQKKEEMEEQKRLQERKLEEERSIRFVKKVSENDIAGAKEELEMILAHREIDHKDNYIYYLFLELIEMIEKARSDSTFELLEVKYTYRKEQDKLYTFFEAISVGDFKKAYEVGKRCRGKNLDSKNSKIKIGTYLSLLEYFFSILEEHQKELDNIYQIVQSNIMRGHYLHALELYQIHKVGLKIYQEELLLDLFQAGIAIENKIEMPTEEKEGSYDISMEELPEIPLEVQNQDKIIEEEITSKLEQLSHTQKGQKEVPTKEAVLPPKNEEEEEEKKVFYPVEPFLFHYMPNNPEFQKFLTCYYNLQLDDARYYLNQYEQLLRANGIHKRLDQFYYAIEVTYMDTLENPSIVRQKEEMYAFAYSEMRNYQFDNALTYLDYYYQLDTTRNYKGYVLEGYIYIQMGKYQEALASFLKANAISPNPDAYYFQGECYYKQKRWNDASFCYFTYNEFYPKERIDVYLNLATCYEKLGKLSRSLKYLKIAEEMNQEQNLGYHLRPRIEEIKVVLEQQKAKDKSESKEERS